MGLWSSLFGWGRKPVAVDRKSGQRREAPRTRKCRFEALEDRRMFDANPLHVGMVYTEDDSGSDIHGDTFELTFNGGAPDTQLTRVVIDGDHFAPGLSFGDMLFDTADGGLGADHSDSFAIVSQGNIQTVRATVVDGTSLLILDFTGFRTGDKLIFSIDVDEVQDFDPAETNVPTINLGIDPIASGVEFQNSKLTASFTAPHYHDISGQGNFRNQYDSILAGMNLNLPADNDGGLRDRTTGTAFPLQQTPLPISISGNVYDDRNVNLIHDAVDRPIGGVLLTLFKKNNAGSYDNTGFTTTTNVNGHYEFGENLNLLPGTYRVVETQPADFPISVGAVPGTVDGATSGQIVVGNKDILTEIAIPFGGQHSINNDFFETKPASIRGSVHLTTPEGDCVGPGQPGYRPVVGATIKLLDAQGNTLQTTFTDGNGEYEFTGLLPGTYQVQEFTPAGLIDGEDDVGSIRGVTVGRLGANDLISNIILAPGDDGINYEFCESEPASISGHVYHDENNNCVRDPNEAPIANVKLVLLDQQGQQVGTPVFTDANGFYQFTNLTQGVYTVQEFQPAPYIQGCNAAGTINGITVGTTNPLNDLITSVRLLNGQHGVNYDFGEILPGSISGRVHVDTDGDCVHDPGELLLSGVVIRLFDGTGREVARTTTDANGEYSFTGLRPGVYAVREDQPAGLLQGGQVAGSKGGDDSQADAISSVPVGSGEDLVEYNFCEVPPSSIRGRVHTDTNENCLLDPGEAPIAGVVIRLFDENGVQVATTTTNANGEYAFENLRAGTYTVKEDQPSAYFDGGEQRGSGGGFVSANDVISDIPIGVGEDLVEYNFCEIPPAQLSGYVFQDGPTIPTSDGRPPADIFTVRDGIFTADDKPLGGVVLELRNGVNGDPITGDMALPGTYGPGPLRTVTDASGYYQFVGLPQGNYAVFEVQPGNYFDGINTPGSTSGIAVNTNQPASQTVLLQFAAVNVQFDAIVRIPLAAGQHSQFNNFSEVVVELPPPIIPPPPPPPPPPPAPPPPPQLFVPPAPPVLAAPAIAPEPDNGSGYPDYTWHLSVVNAGNPRDTNSSVPLEATVFKAAAFLEQTQWKAERMQAGQWSLPNETAEGDSPVADGVREFLFGMPGGIPIAGDFNGDGRDEIGIFYRGEWFLDLNGNGKWDEEDLWARLGTEEDRPVVGDWDGDGKDDIGIFGPIWPRDPIAIEVEPGLPDPHNMPKNKLKNVPPELAEATDGHRILRHTARKQPRADLIDHVFQYGKKPDTPVTGDWNGDGIHTIGTFNNGRWRIDLNGDGRFTKDDEQFVYGEAGDLPVVGDFDGDGTSEIGVFRGGKWIVDINHNHELDAHDKVFEMGGAADWPVVGDWNGDGIDEPGLYRGATPRPAPDFQAAQRKAG